MIKKLRMLFFLLSLMVLCSACTACGGLTRKVPDSYISTYITNKCEEEDEDASELIFSTQHNYDSKAHIDTVLVTLTDEGYYGTYSFQIELKYQYDRSSDLWLLFAESEWEDEYTYTFNDNILGEWHFDEYEDIRLNITDISSTTVTAECTIVSDTFEPFYGTFTALMEEEGMYELNKDRFTIDVTVPEGFYCQDHFGQHLDTAELRVVLGIDAGVCWTLLFGEIRAYR